MRHAARLARVVAVAALALGPGAVESATAGGASPPNVLLIVFDDFRGVPSNPPVGQPNLERFASKAIAFSHAYTQQPSCNPSRTSMLTGLRPSTTGIFDNSTFYRTLLPDVVTLPQLFRANGYFTASVGKVFHNSKLWRDRDTWASESWPTGTRRGLKGKGRRVTGGRFDNDRWLAAKGADSDQPDGAAALAAVELLSAARDRPFFIAVGFMKPHPPYRAPRRDFARYPVPGFPEVWDELPGPETPASVIPNHETASVLATLSLRDQRELMRGYYACATFADRQLGRLLDALDELALWESTVVVVASDHGYHLGEHGWWGKNTLYEESLRVPLLLYAPGVTRAGSLSSRPVELVDLYPTLADIAGLEAPSGLEGRSLRPLLRSSDRTWFPAYSQENRLEAIARSITDGRWRYTEWGPDPDDAELYDLESDSRQKVNLAGDPAYSDIRTELARLLDAD